MYLLSTYTHEVKQYCDERFFERFCSYDCSKMIVDNSQGLEYTERLMKLINDKDVYHIDVPREPQKTRFLRNVTDSANHVRDKFLQGTYRPGWELDKLKIPTEVLSEETG